METAPMVAVASLLYILEPTFTAARIIFRVAHAPINSRRHKREKAPGVREIYIELRKSVHHAAQDKSSCRDGGLERVPKDIHHRIILGDQPLGNRIEVVQENW